MAAESSTSLVTTRSTQSFIGRWIEKRRLKRRLSELQSEVDMLVRLLQDDPEGWDVRTLYVDHKKLPYTIFNSGGIGDRAVNSSDRKKLVQAVSRLRARRIFDYLSTKE